MADSIIAKLIQADREAPKRILVIGDGMTDVYIHGKMEPNGQEKCIKFMEDAWRTVKVPGGAANAAQCLKHWFAGVLFPFNRLKGPTKTRYMVDDKCVFRHDNDTCNFDVQMVRQEALATLTSYQPDAVLLSDYDKGLLTAGLVQEVAYYCHGRKIPCVADAKREPDFYRGCIIKGNGQYFNTKRYPEEARRMDTQAVTTHGEYVPLVWDCGEASMPVVNLPSVKCLNHVGAGDCFAAHLTLALAYGFSLKDSAAIAHSAGRIYVQRRHNTAPHPDEIEVDMNPPLMI